MCKIEYELLQIMTIFSHSPIFKILVLLSVLLVGCDNTPTEPISSELLEENCQREETDNGLYRYYDCITNYRGKPFTGIEIAGNPEGMFRASQLRDGKYHGFSFSASGDKLRSTAWYRDGVAVGESVAYHLETQQTRQRTEYIDGKVVTEKYYDKQGVITGFYRYDGEEMVTDLNQAIESISYDKGRPWIHKFAQDGEKRQRWMRYFANGQLENDKVLLPEQGLQKLSETEYHPNGNVKSQFNFDRETNTAIQHTYRFNGTRSSEQHYIYNPRVNSHGKWLYFCKDSEQVSGVVNYVHGVKQGVSEGYHCNGQLAYREHYKDDKMIDSKVDHFDENGKLFKQEYFYDNGKKRIEYFDEQGQLTDTYHYK